MLKQQYVDEINERYIDKIDESALRELICRYYCFFMFNESFPPSKTAQVSQEWINEALRLQANYPNLENTELSNRIIHNFNLYFKNTFTQFY